MMFDVTAADQREHTMTGRKGKADPIDVKGLLSGDDAFIRTVVRAALQEVLEAEMTVVSDVMLSTGRFGSRRGGT